MNADFKTSDQGDVRRGYAPLSVVAHTSQALLQQAAARFRSAITLQIPVGFEDERGFHYDVLPNAASHSRTSTSTRLF